MFISFFKIGNESKFGSDLKIDFDPNIIWEVTLACKIETIENLQSTIEMLSIVS